STWHNSARSLNAMSFMIRLWRSRHSDSDQASSGEPNFKAGFSAKIGAALFAAQFRLISAQFIRPVAASRAHAQRSSAKGFLNASSPPRLAIAHSIIIASLRSRAFHSYASIFLSRAKNELQERLHSVPGDIGNRALIQC